MIDVCGAISMDANVAYINKKTFNGFVSVTFYRTNLSIFWFL